MKTLLPFLKPYRGKCVFILLVTLADVAGALLIPTITADMINTAVEGSHMDLLLRKGILMLGIALLSGLLTLMGSWLCARLSADLGRDLREAVYDKSLAFSASDFETFGTASMITRTLNDVNIIQQAFVYFLISFRRSKPALWPKLAGRPRFLAQRRLPSTIMAAW